MDDVQQVIPSRINLRLGRRVVVQYRCRCLISLHEGFLRCGDQRIDGAVVHIGLRVVVSLFEDALVCHFEYEVQNNAVAFHRNRVSVGIAVDELRLCAVDAHGAEVLAFHARCKGQFDIRTGRNILHLEFAEQVCDLLRFAVH